MKCRDVPGNIGRYFGEKFRDVSKFLVAVVESGDDERHDLQPESHGIQPLDRIENILEQSAELTIIPILKTLEIDLVEIHPGSDVLQDFRRTVPVRYVRRFQSLRARDFEDLDSPLAGNQRVGCRDLQNRARAGIENVVRIERERYAGSPDRTST